MKVLVGQSQFGPDSLTNETYPQEDLKYELQSDFKKDGEPATWAEGYPKQWGSEYWRFSTGKDSRQNVSSVSATSDEKFLAISTQSSICVFSLDGFRLACVLNSDLDVAHRVEFAKHPARGESGYVLACHAQNELSGRESEVQVWFLNEECKQADRSNVEVTKKREDWKIEGKFAPFAPSAFSPDSRTLLYLSDVHDKWGFHARVTAVNVDTGKEKFHLQGHTGPIMWAGFSPNGKLIATTAWDGYCKLYDGEKGKHIRDYGPTGGQNWACDFSIDSENLAVSRGSGAGPSTFVWRTDDPRSFPISLQGHRGWPRAISWSPDGNGLAIGAADGRLDFYDARSLTLEQVWQLAKVPERIILEVTEVRWTGGGRKILFTPTDGSVQMYDFETNKKMQWGPGEHQPFVSSSWFSLVFMEKSGLLGSVDPDGSFRIWKV